jgi:hypothetical protein
VQLDRVEAGLARLPRARPESPRSLRDLAFVIARPTGFPTLIPYWFTTGDGPRGSQVESAAFFVNQPQWPSWSDAAAPSRCTASVTRRSGATTSGRMCICSAKVRPSADTAQ